MPDNVLDIAGQWFSVIAGTLALLGGAMAFAVRHRMRTKPGSAGHRAEEQAGEVERVGPDGYIDSFANVIEEAGGGLPTMGTVIIVIVTVCYFAYLILFWQPR
jgi:hypothetical protein